MIKQAHGMSQIQQKTIFIPLPIQHLKAHLWQSIGQFLLRIIVIFVSLLSMNSYSQSAYFGAGVGYGQTALPRPAQISFFQRNGPTWSGWFGFLFNRYLGGEVGYVRMDNVQAAGIISGLAVKDTVEPSMTYVTAQGRLPITNTIKAIGKVGGAYVYGKEKLVILGMRTVRSQSKTRPYYAIGAEIDIDEKLSVNATFSSSTKKDLIPRLSVFQIGVQYAIV